MTTLLRTKLNMPPVRPNLVPRPRLIERLNANLHRKLTLVCAPAGFGKSTLVSEWLSQLDCPATWLSLDQNDNDLASFLTYLIAALAQIDRESSAGLVLGQSTRMMLQAPQLPPVESLLTPLMDELTTLPVPSVIVLDDYYTITLPAIHQAVAFFLDHLPPGTHLLMATREDPPIRLSRLRVLGGMADVRARDLRFTEEEAAAFFNQSMGLHLSADQVAALGARTEGWIAGLQLAALTMLTRPAEGIPAFIQAFSGSHRYVTEYLVEEVLDRRPPGTKAFLLQTSILDRFTGPLCDAVTGERDGQKMIKQLEEANLFLIPLDHEQRWYRYHHLFADLLRNQLMASQPDLAPILHRRASAWLEEHDLLSEAIAHSLNAEDFERAAQLAERSYFDRMSHGEDFVTMFGWLAALPDEVIRSRPRLGVMYAWMLSITNQVDAVEPLHFPGEQFGDLLLLRARRTDQGIGQVQPRVGPSQITRRRSDERPLGGRQNRKARERYHARACQHAGPVHRSTSIHVSPPFTSTERPAAMLS